MPVVTVVLPDCFLRVSCPLGGKRYAVLGIGRERIRYSGLPQSIVDERDASLFDEAPPQVAEFLGAMRESPVFMTGRTSDSQCLAASLKGMYLSSPDSRRVDLATPFGT